MHTLWALKPANRASPIEIITAWLVTKGCLFFLIWLANHRLTGGSTVGMFVARNSNVDHSMRTIRRADAAGSVVEIFPALWVPEGTPLLAVIFAFLFLTVFLLEVTRTSAVRSWFFAVCTIVTPIMWTSLPAYGSSTDVAISAKWIAQSSSPLFALSTS